MKKFHLAAALLLCGAPAWAGALLKPTTGVTQTLRAKNVEVKADISGAFARTTATTIYANPNRRQIEADFIYTAPETATVTGFAYWFKGEKVVARVVEKERAADIYNLITVRRRDPALVEMIGKNTFRARISPVEANADLKIEVQYVEPLAATPDGWRWSFPLKQDTANYPPDSVNFSASVAAGATASSNFGAFADGQLSVQKQNVKDADDIRLDVAAVRAPLKVSLLAARDSGGDGFFALALAPDFSATKPNFAISGVQTSDVMRDENARAGQTFVAVGRYRGDGEALVKLGNRSVRVHFTAATSPGNIAAQMWGARRIEKLSQSDANRAAVIHLSKRFGMPSKWTSWLALPDSEKAAFERQLLSLEINRAVGSWAQNVAIGDEKRAKILRQRAYDYRVRLNQLNGEKENLSAKTFQGALNRELDEVIQSAYEKSPDKAKLARLARNLRAHGARTYREVQAQQQREDNQRDAATERVTTPYYAYLEAVENGQPERAAQLLAQSDRAYQAGKDKYFQDDDPRHSLAYDAARSIADSIEYERKEGTQDSSKQQAQLKQLARLSPLAGISETDLLANGKSHAYAHDLQTTSGELNTEVSAGREDGAKAIALRARVEELRQFVHVGNEPGVFSSLSGAYSILATKQGVEYLRALDQGETEKADALLKRVNANLKLAGSYTGDDEPRKVDLKSNLARSWGNIRSEESAVLSKEIIAKREDSPAAENARRLIEQADNYGASTEYDNNTYYDPMPEFAWKSRAHETAYLLVKARQNGDNQTAQLLQKQLKTEVEKADSAPLDAYIEWEKSRIKRGEPIITSEQYVLRPGDPLISVSAPASCQRVVAILPSGELLPLVYDGTQKSWQARFDVPTYAAEGDYKVQILIVAADGVRHQMTMTFAVDTTAPGGKGGAIFGADGLQLHLEADEQTDRVSAFTPWNERIELRRDASGIFGAAATVPAEWRGKATVVRFVLTDKAHNRTEIAVDWSQ